MSAREVDVHTLPTMLTALRLPSFHKHWSSFAERADNEDWPAASFLAALAQLELAERETRRIQRHLAQSADFADSGEPFRKVADPRFGKSRTALGVKIEEPCFVQG